MKRRTYLAQKQQLAWRNLIVALSIAGIAGILLLLFYNLGLPGKSKAAGIGMHGAKSITTGTVKLNEFTTLTSNAALGATTINVAASSLNSNSRFSTGSLKAGELVLIIQMQGATISTANSSSYGSVTAYNNSGKYEFAQVSSIPNSTSITLTTGLKNAYTATGKVQVVRVPRFTSLSLSAGATITTDAWDGSKGGILALEVTGVSTINGTIDASALGFRGGAIDNSAGNGVSTSLYLSTSSSDGAEKGESIAGSQSDLSANGKYGRGAPANGGGGGNAHNCGGGGGANGGTGTWNGNGTPDNSVGNWTTAWNLESASFSNNTSSGGGRGGYGWSLANKSPLTYGPGNANWAGDNRPNGGGLGGRTLDYSTGRIFMGGGGGAGDANNGTGTPGGEGGGIVFILAGGNISGSGYIKANGESAAATATTSNGDAAGGGGGGGTIVVYQKNSNVSGLNLQANGGNGGNHVILSTYSPETEGPGAGGGGGFIALSSDGGVSKSVAGGVNGTTNSNVFTNFLPNGATKGASGTANGTAPTNPYSGTSTLPVELLKFTARPAGDVVELEWTVASEKNNDYYTIVRSGDNSAESELCRVKAKEWKGGVLKYTAIDPNPSGTRIYYSLAQTDLDGTKAQLARVSVSFVTDLKEMTIDGIGPNPFSEEVRVTLKAPSNGSASLELYSISGQLIESKQFEVSSGSTTLNYFPQNTIAGGTYLLVVKANNKLVGSRKLSKK